MKAGALTTLPHHVTILIQRGNQMKTPKNVRPKVQVEARADVFDDFGLDEEVMATLKKTKDFAENGAPRKRTEKSMRDRGNVPEWFGVAEGPEELAKLREKGGANKG